MLLSVIILAYKVPYHVLLCVQSVERSIASIDAEIIVVDNNSQDETEELITTNFERVIFQQNNENLGFAKAYNQAVHTAKGKYVCILNPDTVLSENCFKTLIPFAEKQPDFGALGPRLIDGTGHYLPESKRNVPDFKVAFKKMTGDTSRYYANQLAQDEIGEVPVLVGAFMLVKKQAYLKIKGFDERFFMYGEDIDLSYRLTQNGFKNYYFGQVSVIHFKGESTVKDRKYNLRFYGAMQLFQQKHFSQGFFIDKALDLSLKCLAFSKSKVASKEEDQKEKTAIFWVYKGNLEQEELKNIPFQINQVINFEKEKELQKFNSKLIFDLNFLKFSEVIDAFQLLKNNKNRFRIRPSNCNFILGSDTSTSRGELLKW
ncbi:glycosyltransferase family 2 protein [Leeuwenhoekiella blandensis]|uniref:Glycosyl transferase, group 2 family protein n=1 Tax=Leeuwenhoekiella blandensis (strain CECT 7118 / CCUG 51940 / KCTC 22103 / MED217) TaxID=398720 RepID=A3XLP1_LEEBM|nr:glycosyltransferase family 2 protein [Leeuwenhoekiella blandensis]EAQ49528.1 glycosyl transferase, group 2 family protein [Leeuwenhoekiella blandensis MED217]